MNHHHLSDFIDSVESDIDEINSFDPTREQRETIAINR